MSPSESADPRRGLRGDLHALPRSVWSLILGTLCASAGAAFYFPMLTLFCRETLHLSMSWVGTMFLTGGLIGAIGSWLGGIACDRVGRIPVMGFGLGGRSCFAALLAWCAWSHAEAHWVALFFLLSSLTGSAFQPAAEAMLADSVADDLRVHAYGLLRVARNGGWALGPALGGLLALVSYGLLFLVAALAMAGAALVILFLASEGAHRRNTARFRGSELIAVGKDRLFLRFGMTQVLLACLMGQLVSTLSVFAVETLQISKPQVGLLYTLNGALVVVFQMMVTRWTARWRFTTALMIGAALYGLGYGAMTFATGFGALAGLMVVITAGEMMVSPSAVSLAAGLAPVNARGSYLGAFGLFHQVGWSLGPWAGGLALDALAPHREQTWLYLGTIGFAAAAGFAALRSVLPPAADRAGAAAAQAAPAPGAAVEVGTDPG